MKSDKVLAKQLNQDIRLALHQLDVQCQGDNRKFLTIAYSVILRIKDDLWGQTMDEEKAAIGDVTNQ